MPGSLKEQAYQAIKHRIITCAFKPGQELSENTVANALKIGRTPVHQAFDRLLSEGLVDIQPIKLVSTKSISGFLMRSAIATWMLLSPQCAFILIHSGRM